jgi:hypothetical protein
MEGTEDTESWVWKTEGVAELARVRVFVAGITRSLATSATT